MQKFENFEDFIEMEAIATYLRSFGYKARVDTNTLKTYVKDPLSDTFVELCIPNWDTAREFIKVRSQA
jgi:hypothetical protein